MRGCESDPGMMVLCIRDILDWIAKHPDIQYTMRVAYLEVYNEEINDLLGDQSKNSQNLKIVSEDALRGAVIGGLVEETANTAEDFMAILRRGEAARAYASTNMNEQSSRSHTIYRVSIEAKEKASSSSSTSASSVSFDTGDDESSPGRISYLNLVDLAGSERQKSTKAEGKVLKEGANINKSLLALGAVINKLGEASKKNVRYPVSFVSVFLSFLMILTLFFLFPCILSCF
jgi:centromeric protein E